VTAGILSPGRKDLEDTAVNGLPTGRVIRRILLLGALFPCAGAVMADPIGAVAPAHGALLMVYVSQPLGSHSASRVYGLRIDQGAFRSQPVSAPAPVGGFYAFSPQRSLVDLQIGRQADVRVKFGQRLTWNVRRTEFELPGAHPASTIDFAIRH
jgi:hypothetical protein